MTTAPASSPAGSDGMKSAGKSSRRMPVGRFEWVSSSPSPVEVAELERLFPEIIQVPVQALEDEASVWVNQAILARSLCCWVPPEAIVREFHRAGVIGEVDDVPLAHRHYLFRFSDIHAKDLVLGRPWVVNGQPIVVAEWQPEFIPANDTLLSALLWIRLPLLPMDFWSDEILASILSVAGEFQFSDDATKMKSRGGFARACVRVNLANPLRPGARIRGSKAPFWQQFSYEHVDGICARCGSIHLGGICDQPLDLGSSSTSQRFGPWMATVRRRRPPQVPSSAPLDPTGSKAASPSASIGGWQTPKKIARRQSGRTPSGSVASKDLELETAKKPCQPLRGVPVVTVPEPLSELQDLIAVPVHLVDKFHSDSVVGNPVAQMSGVPVGEETVILTKAQKLKGEMGSFAAAPLSSSKQPGISESNPFTILGSDIGSVGMDSVSGPPKRARPVESVVHRVVSKSTKAKGKAPLVVKGSAAASFTFSASLDSARGPSLGTKKSRSSVGPNPGLANHQEMVPGHNHETAVLLLKQAIQPDDAVEGMESSLSEDCSGMVLEEGSLPTTSHCDEDMSVANDGVPPSLVSG